jgi:hypothetical protein
VSAFFTTPEAPSIHQAVIDYIEAFVPEHSGEHYMPHVTTGLAGIEDLNKMLAEPFEPFTSRRWAWTFINLATLGRRRRNSRHWI